jgi:DNA-directed RNA polymerase specialized sigma24 family protein
MYTDDADCRDATYGGIMQDPAADTAIARKVLSREPTGYAALYDRYAAPLYAYCCAMLGDPERAAGALGVTLMIPACRLGELRDPGRLRPWMYALARDECRCRADPGPAGSAAADAGSGRRDRGRGSQAPPAEEGEPPAAAEFSRAGIAGAALRWLSLDDREAVELCLRHHLIGLDLADVLGMPPRRAHAAVTRAAGRLRRALGPLLVARLGREDCPDLDAMLAGWDGQPTVLLDRRVRRHIRYCDTCRARERRELPPGALGELLAKAAPPAPPPGLRDYVLRVLAVTPGSAAEGDPVADLVTHRAGPFGPSGFPAPPGRGNWHPPTQLTRRPARRMAGFAATGAAVVLYGVILGGASLPTSASPSNSPLPSLVGVPDQAPVSGHVPPAVRPPSSSPERPQPAAATSPENQLIWSLTR